MRALRAIIFMGFSIIFIGYFLLKDKSASQNKATPTEAYVKAVKDFFENPKKVDDKTNEELKRDPSAIENKMDQTIKKHQESYFEEENTPYLIRKWNEITAWFDNKTK
jgi:hypothetical protein